MRPIELLSFTVALCVLTIVLLIARMSDHPVATTVPSDVSSAAMFRYPDGPSAMNGTAVPRWQLPARENATSGDTARNSRHVLPLYMDDDGAPQAGAPRFYYPVGKRTYSL